MCSLEKLNKTLVDFFEINVEKISNFRFFLNTVGFIISVNLNLPLFDLKGLDSFSKIFPSASHL